MYGSRDATHSIKRPVYSRVSSRSSGLDEVRLQSHEIAMKDTSGINDVGHRQEIDVDPGLTTKVSWPM